MKNSTEDSTNHSSGGPEPINNTVASSTAVVNRLQNSVSANSQNSLHRSKSHIHLDPNQRSIHGGVSFALDEKHWMCTFATDSTGQKRMLRYDIRKLVNIGGIGSMFCKGTIFTMDRQLLKSVSFYLLGMCGEAILIVATMEKAELAEFDTMAMETLTGFINGFVPFVLALYVSLVLQRWWALRTQALGAIFNAVSNTTLIVASSLPGEKWAKLRSEIVRLGMSSIFLVVNAAHGSYDLTPLVTQGLLHKEEQEVCEEVELFQRASMMWVWILRICAEGFDTAKVPPPRYNTIVTKAMQARDGVQTIHTYLDTQLPFAYVHLITLLVNLQNLVFAVKCGFVSAVAYSTGETQQIIVQIMMCALVIVIYQGLLICSYIIHDPFGEDLLDFPIIAYTEYLSWTCSALQRGSSHCPALHPDKRAELLGHGWPPDAGSTAKGKTKHKQKVTKPESPAAPTAAPRNGHGHGQKERNKHSEFDGDDQTMHYKDDIALQIPESTDPKPKNDPAPKTALHSVPQEKDAKVPRKLENLVEAAGKPWRGSWQTLSPDILKLELKEDEFTTSIKSLDAAVLTAAIKSLASELSSRVSHDAGSKNRKKGSEGYISDGDDEDEDDDDEDEDDDTAAVGLF